MDDQLKNIRIQFASLSEQLQDPRSFQDPDLLRRLTREHSRLSPIIEALDALETARTRIAEAKALLTDPEFHALAREELLSAEVLEQQCAGRLKDLLRPRDPNDGRPVLMEIRSGVGGEESALFAGDLLRMYLMYAQKHAWHSELVSVSHSEYGGLKECSLLIDGADAWQRLRFEGGVHRVQRVPETESTGRIHTSAATVAVMPEADEIEVSIDPKDLKIDVYRASGAGGQHVNKTESAVRITHIPTGLVVECQDERSQIQNRERAMKVLRTRLLDRLLQERTASETAARRAMVGSGDRSERIRTYNFPQGRVTDHRINLTLYRLDAVLNGDLDELTDALGSAYAKSQEPTTEPKDSA